MTMLAKILLIEDNEPDIEFVRYVFHEAKLCNKFDVISDGHEAVDYLFKRGAFSDVPTPDLVFLDISLPGLSGEEILDQIRQNPETASLPVVVLSGGPVETALTNEIKMKANHFLSKPLDFHGLIDVVRQISSLFFGIVVEEKRK